MARKILATVSVLVKPPSEMTYGWYKVGKLSLRAKREVSFALHERDFSVQNLPRA